MFQKLYFRKYLVIFETDIQKQLHKISVHNAYSYVDQINNAYDINGASLRGVVDASPYKVWEVLSQNY